jgi:hypothetical protein
VAESLLGVFPRKKHEDPTTTREGTVLLLWELGGSLAWIRRILGSPILVLAILV